jgi:hypothetical protein
LVNGARLVRSEDFSKHSVTAGTYPKGGDVSQ